MSQKPTKAKGTPVPKPAFAPTKQVPKATPKQILKRPSVLPSPQSQRKSQLMKAGGFTHLYEWEELPPHLRTFIAAAHGADDDGVLSMSKRNALLLGNRRLLEAEEDGRSSQAALIDRALANVLGAKWSTVIKLATSTATMVNQATEAAALGRQVMVALKDATGLSAEQSWEAVRKFANSLVVKQEQLGTIPLDKAVGSSLKVSDQVKVGDKLETQIKAADSRQALNLLNSTLNESTGDQIPTVKSEAISVSSAAATRSTVAAAATVDMHGYHRITHVARTKEGTAIVVAFRQAAFRCGGGAAVGAPWLFGAIGTTTATALATPEGGVGMLIGPDECGNMWAKIATLYEKYHLEEFSLEYATQVGSLVSGGFVMAISKDAAAVANFPSLGFGEASQFELNTKAAVWEPSKRLSYHCPDMGDYLYVSRYVDPRLCNVGTVFVTPTGTTPASAVNEIIGNFYVSGTCILTVPTPDLGITMGRVVSQAIGKSNLQTLAAAIEANPIPFYRLIKEYGVVPDETKEDDEVVRVLQRMNLIQVVGPTPYEKWRSTLNSSLVLSCAKKMHDIEDCDKAVSAFSWVRKE